MASGRKRVELLQRAVEAFNLKPNAPFVTDQKHLADRFKLLMEQFERQDNVRKAQSGREDELELTELDKLLADAARAKEEWLQAKESGEEAKNAKEARLRHQGGQARDAMMRRRRA